MATTRGHGCWSRTRAAGGRSGGSRGSQDGAQVGKDISHISGGLMSKDVSFHIRVYNNNNDDNNDDKNNNNDNNNNNKYDK